MHKLSGPVTCANLFCAVAKTETPNGKLKNLKKMRSEANRVNNRAFDDLWA